MMAKLGPKRLQKCSQHCIKLDPKFKPETAPQKELNMKPKNISDFKLVWKGVHNVPQHFVCVDAKRLIKRMRPYPV